MFFDLEQHDPQRLAVIDDHHKEMSYGALLAAVSLLEQRLLPGQLVFILCQNTPGALIGYLACLRVGAVPLMLDAALNHNRLCELENSYHPAWLWQPDESVGHGIVWRSSGYQLTQGKAESFPMHPDLALLMTTSGSTGSPKLVRLSQRNLQSNADSIKQYLAIDENERPYVHLPIHYVFGLSIVNSHLQAGATLILTQHSLMQREFWTNAAENNITSLSGVPYTFEMLNRLRFTRMSLPSLNTLTQAGGKLSPKLHQLFADYASEQGKRFIVMYGAAEATSRMAWLPAEQAVEKCGFIGQAIPGGELSLEDEQGKVVVEPGQQGELVYRGENVMMGYANSGVDLLRGNELNGELRTGDLARFDPQGCFEIIGRKKRFLKIFGNRVGLDEMENVLKTQFIGLACACVGRDDRLTVFLTDESLAAEVKRYAAQTTQLHPSAFRITVIENIPLTASGKTHYERLNEDESRI
jgi:acyl-CoA synthetase (AMP-forming)/AMP-acid ligase II